MNKPYELKDCLPDLKRKTSNDNNVIENIYNVNNVDELSTEDLLKVLDGKFSFEHEKQKWLANHLAEKLNNQKDTNYYRKIVTQYDPGLLLECLSITTAATKEKNILKPGAYFVGVLKHKKPP